MKTVCSLGGGRGLQGLTRRQEGGWKCLKGGEYGEKQGCDTPSLEEQSQWRGAAATACRCVCGMHCDSGGGGKGCRLALQGPFCVTALECNMAKAAAPVLTLRHTPCLLFLT
jgi:hypothetical protein